MRPALILVVGVAAAALALTGPTSASQESARPSSADVADVAAVAKPFSGSVRDVAVLADQLADADIVLLGEPTHGTREFYDLRAKLSLELVERAGFAAIAIEGDWADAWRTDRYIHGRGPALGSDDALSDFTGDSPWMWRNGSFAAFVDELRTSNSHLPYRDRASLYGLDLYDTSGSVTAIGRQLGRLDRTAAAAARDELRCAGSTGTENVAVDATRCVDHVHSVVASANSVYESMAGESARRADLAFSAVRNAEALAAGRRYQLGEDAADHSPSNIRDTHMASVVAALRTHVLATGRGGKLIVWAHNSHVGDSRATEPGRSGNVSLGRLAREMPGVKTAIVGFSTTSGSVTAASAWATNPAAINLRAPLDDSWQALFHSVRASLDTDFSIALGPEAPSTLRSERLERFIGVVYRPEDERFSHYYSTTLADEYDFLIHIDATTAVRPLDG